MRYYHYCFVCLLALYSCKSPEKNEKTSSLDSMKFYVGTYTDEESEGIYKYELNENGEIKLLNLVAKTENPSFLAMSKDKRHLLAVNEIAQGKVESYSIEGDSLTLINSSDSEGASPCFIAINEEGFVLAANYSSGTVSLLHLDHDGKLSAPLDVNQHSGQGTSPRQEGPHAHSSYFGPNSNDVVSVDLGTNELLFFNLDHDSNELKPRVPYRLAMEPGAGPRHLTFHPNQKFLYVLNELNSTVSVIENTTDSIYKIKENYSTLSNEFKEMNSGADIHISSDGKFLYASNRGHNSIAIFAVESEGEELRLIDNISTEGEWPRNFSLSPDNRFLVVANQHSDNLVSFKRNDETGQLELIMSVNAPSPVNVLFE